MGVESHILICKSYIVFISHKSAELYIFKPILSDFEYNKVNERIVKLFFVFVLTNMSAILTTHFRQFFSTDQHDFVKGRSTVTNLIEFTNQAITH